MKIIYKIYVISIAFACFYSLFAFGLVLRDAEIFFIEFFKVLFFFFSKNTQCNKIALFLLLLILLWRRLWNMCPWLYFVEVFFNLQIYLGFEK